MKIICIGRNYLSHVQELHNEAPKEPVIFMKPDTALLRNNEAFYIPSFSNEVHYECELVVRIHRIGKNIAKQFARRYYNEIGLGIDFTARDIQNDLRAKGLPWEKAKAFDKSAVIGSEFIPVEDFEDVNQIEFRLEKNGILMQAGNTADMLFSIDELIAEISKYYTLKIGDLIYTGTPKGVGAISIGDTFAGFVGDKKMFDFEVK